MKVNTLHHFKPYYLISMHHQNNNIMNHATLHISIFQSEATNNEPTIVKYIPLPLKKIIHYIFSF